MKAVLFQSNTQGLRYEEVPTPSPGNGQVLIKLNYAALNHLDLWIWKEQSLPTAVIPGSDGAGVVSAVGSGVDSSLVGKEVIINPSLNWDGDERIPGDKFEILGLPTNGTFAEYIVVPAEYVYEKPVHLSLREAAALPLAGLTAYRALFTKAQLTASDTVLITGIGGGAALYLLQMAVAHGAAVFVTSSSEEKIQKAIVLGARGGYNYKDPNWVSTAKAEAHGFDVIVDSAGGNGFAALTEVANAGARMVVFGRTAGDINNLKPGMIFNKQLQISGTVMGTQKEFAAMLAFYQKHGLRPVIDSQLPLHDVLGISRYMEEGKHFGKVVFEVNG